MENSGKSHSKTLKKCRGCRKLFDDIYLQEHLAQCRFILFEKQAHKVMIKCRGCGQEFQDSKFFLHLNYKYKCRKNYTKPDFVTIFELWERFYSKDSCSHIDMKKAYNNMEQNLFAECSIVNDIFCNSCGESLELKSLDNHLQNSDKCKKDFKNLPAVKCKTCSNMYSRLLIHFKDSTKCKLLACKENDTVPKPSLLQDKDKKFVECKGCKFLIETRKLILHLNNPVTKDCKSSFSKSDYSTALSYWIESQIPKQSSSNPTQSKKMTCKGCGSSVNVNQMVLHLNNPNTLCNKEYTKLEHTVLFEVWSDSSSESQITVNDLVDQTKTNILRCKGCLTLFQASQIGDLKCHIENHPDCKCHYDEEDLQYVQTEHDRFTSWIGILGHTSDTFKLQTAELDDEDLDRILRLEYKPTIDSMIDKDSKPYFIEMSAIQEFKFFAMARDFRNTYALLLGYENEFGFHSTEMIHASVVASSHKVSTLGVRPIIMTQVEKSKTFQEYKENALILVWMSTPRKFILHEEWIFNGYNAHNQIQFRKKFPKTIGMCYDGMDNNDMVDFYELNELGMSTVGLCVELKDQAKRNPNVQGPFCCSEGLSEAVAKELFRFPHVRFTYSNRITIQDLDPARIYELEPTLFKRKYFATLPQQQEFVNVRESSETHNDTEETCTACSKPLKLSTILKHLAHNSSCKESYDKEEYISLTKRVSSFKSCNNSNKRRERYLKNRDSSSTPKARSAAHENQKQIICQGCKGIFNTHIKKHLANKDQCRLAYTEKQFKDLEDEIDILQKENKKQKNKAYYDSKIKKVSNKTTIECKGCGNIFNISAIKNHIKHGCSGAYTAQDMKTLNESIQVHKLEVRRSINANYYQNKKNSLQNKVDEFAGCLESSEKYEFCLCCKRSFEISKILKHLTHVKECKEKYSKEAYDALVLKCEKFKRHVRKINRQKKLQDLED